MTFVILMIFIWEIKCGALRAKRVNVGETVADVAANTGHRPHEQHYLNYFEEHSHTNLNVPK